MTALKIILIVIGCWVVLRFVLKRLIQLPAPGYMGYLFSSGFRLWLQPPRQIISRSGVKSGMTVVDLGCGSGPYTPYAARAVGVEGRVYAVDIQRWMLHQLKRRLARKMFKDVTNVEITKASAYDMPFESDSIDLVYMVAVLGEIPDERKGLREIMRVLKPGGILAITEMFPDPDYHTPSSTIKLCRGEGFTFEAREGHFWNYTARFRK